MSLWTCISHFNFLEIDFFVIRYFLLFSVKFSSDFFCSCTTEFIVQTLTHSLGSTVSENDEGENENVDESHDGVAL